ncbi:ATP-binding protein [Lysobacter niabensis]|uniref:sensor histidine kinase n=1 Tax=Agrilutibacter niabensis TaxID=380628 RepID=UPI00360F44F8
MTQDDALQQAQLQLDAARRQLQLLTDTVTHDLRAPLRTIEGFAALVADSAHDRLDERERGQLQRVREAAARMSSLLEALAEFSRATNAPLQPVEVDISLVAEWVLADLQAAEPQRRAQIHVQPGLSARGDERLLRLMLVQLLNNAWKFSAASAVTRIEVTGERGDGTCRFSIRDSGIGYDVRYAHKLFEPLQRLHAAEEGAGHGLGLAIAQRIATRHGGTIAGVSQIGDGAAFTVELPDA